MRKASCRPRLRATWATRERIWWHLHEDLTRNHRCRSLDELLAQVYDWATAGSFHFQTANFRQLYVLAA